jgi:hypothetical protein
MPGHVPHLAVFALIEPALQVGGIGGDGDVGHTERIETAILGQ